MQVTVKASENLPAQELVKKLDQEINNFDKHFTSVSNSKLTPMEKELIKAYLFYKIKVEK